MSIPITAFTAGALAIWLVVLSLRVIKLRLQHQVSLGDGGNEPLQRAVRGQGNLAEYGPMGIALVLVGELQGVDGVLLAVMAAGFVAGRLCHGYAMSFTPGHIPLRRNGMRLTFFPLLLLALVNIGHPILGWLDVKL